MDYCCDFERDVLRLRSGELELSPKIYDSKTGKYISDMNVLCSSPNKVLDEAIEELNRILKK